MNPIGSVRTIVGAEGGGGVDWAAARAAARELTDSGDLDLDPAVKAGYARDMRAARTEIAAVSGIDFALPRTVEVQNRHHWIDRTVDILEAVLEPLSVDDGRFPGLTGPLNTATVSGSVAYLSRLVLGQYDPRLFSGEGDHGLYVVHPNVVEASRKLSVDEDRFRRWIAFHEVAHAAEFAAAPWLRDYLETRIRRVVSGLDGMTIPRTEYQELDRVMTVVEGYAELLMDEAFDEPSAELRRKLDERRSSGGLISRLLGQVIGLDRKREQYERGRDFFDVIVAERGLKGAGRVWEDPAFLPNELELERPDRWLDRVPPGQ